MSARVLIVDDDAAVSMVISGLLQQAGYRTVVAHSGEAALEALDEWVDLIITDVRMPGMDGLQLLDRLRTRGLGLPVIVISAFATTDVAIEAMRRGAVDFVQKPFDRDEVLASVRRALERKPRDEDAPPPVAPAESPKILGRSAAIRQTLSLVDRAARSRSRVLLRGESGTGKELVAARIHAHSDRAGGPFVAVNCAALPDTLIEAELFGHEAGAFTGATRAKPGRVELAEGGTLFLDEIGDLGPSVQAKLLRFLEAGSFERLGSGAPRKADVRVVAATLRDLEGMVEEGSFREDLFFRLDVLTIHLPPLRERGDDVRLMAEHFFEALKQQEGRTELRLAEDALEALQSLRWPGNVRELRNVMERLVVFAEGQVVDAETVQAHHTSLADDPVEHDVEPGTNASIQLDATRRKMLADALERTRGNRSQAARILGISRRTLYRWMGEE